MAAAAPLIDGTPNSRANSASVWPPRTAASATLALKAGATLIGSNHCGEPEK